MQFAKRLLMVAGAVTLTGLLGVAIVPKAAHAIVATLVQVVNTSANPVPTYDSGTRFEASICYGFGPVSAASNACVPDANTNTFKVPMVTLHSHRRRSLYLRQRSQFPIPVGQRSRNRLQLRPNRPFCLQPGRHRIDVSRILLHERWQSRRLLCRQSRRYPGHPVASPRPARVWQSTEIAGISFPRKGESKCNLRNGC
jgi:hypothetical protein